MKHTPGPWELVGVVGDLEVVAKDANGSVVPLCGLYHTTRGTRPDNVPTAATAEANGILIASSPDMLAALKAILANDGSAGTYDLLKVSDAREAARAAIARAEGGAA